MPLHRRAFCVGMGAALLARRAWAQPSSIRESAVKAAFLLKFASFVEWPAGTLPRSDQPMVIAVLGDDEVAVELESMVAGRQVEGRAVAIRRLTDRAGAGEAQILYIANRREIRLREVVDAVPGPVLVVGDSPEALRAGAVLAFTPDAGRVRFSASLRSADARNLKLSARLLAVASSVEGRSR